MAQSEGFKHITVTAAEDEDVVIVAGAVAEEGGDAVQVDPAETAVDVPDVAKASARENEAAPKPVADAPETAKPKAAKQAPSKRSKRKGDSYHETTLEDLQSTPMSFTQRVVIIAAIVCIIGAVIYCVAFMG